MSNAQTFIDALYKLEQERDVEPIAALFADGAQITNPLSTETGQVGARAFWEQYRATFEEIGSSFANVIETDDVAMLEWSSEGTLDGRRFSYGGVSVIESGDGGITAFRTYFDPSKIERTVKG